MSDVRANLEVIQRSRRYHLVAGEDFYGVLHNETDEIERFPETDEGLDRAEDRFRELRLLDRRRRWRIDRILLAAVALGALTWLAGGIALAVTFSLPGPMTVEWAMGLDSVGFRLTMGGLAALTALLLLRLARRAEQERTLLPTLRGGRVTTVLMGVLVGALLIWVVAGLVLRLVPELGPPSQVPVEFGELFIGTEFTRAYRIVDAVSQVAFRVWVAALVLLGIALARPLLRGPEPSAQRRSVRKVTE